MMSPEQAVFAAILVCVAGAALTLLTSARRTLAGWLAFLFTAASAALVAVASVSGLTGGKAAAAAGWLAAGAACQRLQVDGLSAVFLLLTALVAVPASLYSLGYVGRHSGSVARYYTYSLIFLAALYGLFSTADTTWWFLIFWQLMVFSGYALIRFHRETGAQGANRFAIMLELACASIVAGTGLLDRGGAQTWHIITANAPALHVGPSDSALALFLLLLGFGITMGLWPFGQMWLPQASPGSPAPVSALLCGVVIKIGVYGLIRYFIFLVPPNAGLSAWGTVVAVLGTITLFAGTMQALQQEGSKRLLAFHSIGQMGYVVLAVGTCLTVAHAPAAAAIASLALVAALFHVVNHSLFSSLLYFNAGSVLEATGTQDLNRLGGLMSYMPLTGLTALVGALSISGVPLFNGFASKWAIFVAAIQGAGWAGYLAVCAAIAILTSGLTLASFIKFFGTAFLSRTSDLVAKKAGLPPSLQGAHPRAHIAGAQAARLEVDWSMQAPQLLLASLCVLLGLIPSLAFAPLQQAVTTSQGLGTVLAKAPAGAGALAGVAGPQGTALFVPLAVLAALGGSFCIAYIISKLGSASRRAAAPWLGGYTPEAECHRYIAHNFYGEIKRHFRWLGGMENGKAMVKGRTS